MTFHLPQQFGDRECDRTLIALLRALVPSLSRHAAIGHMLMVWRDFASGREDRRIVPEDAAQRARSMPVSIIESFIGWDTLAGAAVSGLFVESAIRAGFFILVPAEPGTLHLVLTGFFPANQPAGAVVSASRIGGIRKGINISVRKADASAREQLDMFKAAANPLLSDVGERDLKEALMFVHQLCNVLQRPHPRSEFWRRELAQKAVTVRRTTTTADLDSAFRWLSMHRQSPEIPAAIDMVLDAFPDLVRKATTFFGKG